MRIISSYKQGQGIAHLMNILNALRSDDEIDRLDAVGDVADIAYIIGGLKMMRDIKDMQFDKEQKRNIFLDESIDETAGYGEEQEHEHE